MLAIENCVRANRHGARFLDATLCGIGRSAGNAPTEILVAVLDRLNISTGVDLFKLMDVIEEYMWPLVGQIRPHDMVGVVSGYSNFHSGFLEKVVKVAEYHNVDLRRLIAKVSLYSQETIKDDHLNQAAQEIMGTMSRGVSDRLVSFDVPEVAPHRLSHSLMSVNALVNGLVVTSSKRPGSKIVLQLVPSNEVMENLVIPEFICSDEQAVVGRVRYGSMNVLRQVVEMTKSNVFMYLVNKTSGWAKDALDVITPLGQGRHIVPIRDEELKKAFLLEVLDRASQLYGHQSCLIYGSDPLIARVLSAGLNFEKVFLFNGQNANPNDAGQTVNLSSLSDGLKIRFNVILIAANPEDSDAEMLSQLVSPKGKIFSIIPHSHEVLQSMLGEKFIYVPLNLAYAGIVSRCMATERYLK